MIKSDPKKSDLVLVGVVLKFPNAYFGMVSSHYEDTW
jgi:hypothetical protein